MPAPIPNLCFRCGGKSPGAHTDGKGRSLCPGCADHANRTDLIDLAAPLGPPAEPAPAPAGPHADQQHGHPRPRLQPKPALARREVSADDDLGPIELAPLPPPTITRAPCPHCRAAMQPGELLCSMCGKSPAAFEPPKRPRVTEAIAPEARPICGKCGYDLAGLKSGVCPECGTAITLGSRHSHLAEASAQVTRWEYQKPAIMAAIGCVLSNFITAATNGWADAGWYTLLFPFRVLLATGAFIVCGLVWVGLDAPIKLTFVRFAGILGLVDLASSILASTNLPARSLLILIGGGMLYIYLLVELFELELVDAWGVSIVTFTINLSAFGILFWVLSII